MLIASKEFVRKKDLLVLLTKKEITLKYKRTFLGIIWSLLNPILFSIVLIIAFKIFLRIQMENYAFFFLSALFPWNWFSASVIISTGTLIGNVNLLKRIRFPRHFLILAVVLAQLVNFIFALPILVALSWYYANGPSINWILSIPILVIIQFGVITGICLIISMVNAYFRDMEYIVGIAINLLFWITPIIFPLNAIPEKYRSYLILNPLTYLINSWRDIFMSNLINWNNIGIAFVTSLLVLFLGILIFRHLGRKLDEVL